MKAALITKKNVKDTKLIAEYLGEKCIAVSHWTENPGALLKQFSLNLDIAIIDLHLSDGLDGLEFARKVKRMSPKIYCIVRLPLQDFHIKFLIHYDVNGYLSLDHSLADMIKCIETLQEGYRYVCPAIHDFVNKTGLQNGLLPEDANGLSEQERKVLQLLMTGMPSKEIAEKLYISINTLNNHKTNIRNKLKLHSNRELLSYALKSWAGKTIYD